MTSGQEHIWIEVTDLQSLPERVWMCNLHPGEEERRKQWETPPGAVPVTPTRTYALTPREVR